MLAGAVDRTDLGIVWTIPGYALLWYRHNSNQGAVGWRQIGDVMDEWRWDGFNVGFESAAERAIPHRKGGVPSLGLSRLR